MALHVMMICLHTSNTEDSLSYKFVFCERNRADSEAFGSTNFAFSTNLFE
jgi:hypothetical protein